jgi:hypothetical protein
MVRGGVVNREILFWDANKRRFTGSLCVREGKMGNRKKGKMKRKPFLTTNYTNQRSAFDKDL